LINVSGCAGIETAATIISAGSSTALFTNKLCLFKWWCEEKFLYTAECAYDSEHLFSDDAVAGMDEEDLNWSVAHNEKYNAFCKKITP
jgi:hypothetical protein